MLKKDMIKEAQAKTVRSRVQERITRQKPFDFAPTGLTEIASSCCSERCFFDYYGRYSIFTQPDY
jgi:hypothetical protein